jgi:hypothetical protein
MTEDIRAFFEKAEEDTVRHVLTVHLGRTPWEKDYRRCTRYQVEGRLDYDLCYDCTPLGGMRYKLPTITNDPQPGEEYEMSLVFLPFNLMMNEMCNRPRA